MTNTSMPPHLERIGRQLTAAADDLSRAPRRSRGRAIGVLAASTTGLAAIATAAVLALGATTNTPPAFAVTRFPHGSVSLKINRETSLADVNRKLAAMGIEKLGKAEWAGKGARTADDKSASIPNCSSVPPGWKGQWEQMAGSSSGPGYSISESVAPGTWVLVYCSIGSPPGTGTATSGTTGNTGNTGAG
jgi:hypothetical protein